jgi:POT family proton-dependent oligopeptide transporter
MIATVMGGWFLATAFSNLLGGIIAQLTGVSHGEEGAGAVPAPVDTVHVYGDVFGQIAVACGVATLILFALSPLLQRWMHAEVAEDTTDAAPSRGH